MQAYSWIKRIAQVQQCTSGSNRKMGSKDFVTMPFIVDCYFPYEVLFQSSQSRV
jgi:hypothetical protein